MDTIDNTEWDIVISGTGLPQSLLSLALSRSGKRILHVDRNDYYGGNEAALSLSEAEQWAAKYAGQAQHPRASFSHASVKAATPNDGPEKRLGSSRAYSLALAPQLIYARSDFIGALIASQTTNQLEFLAVGSWFVVKPSTGDSSPEATITKVPSGREDIFRDSSLNVRVKRSLMQFLRYVITYEEQEDWEQKKSLSFTQELEKTFGLPAASHGPLLALALPSTSSREMSMQDVIPRIAQHLRSIGVLGPGFSAVLPKWGGLAEVVQVACRACAVGGGVYVLGKGVKAATQTFKDQLSLELSDGEKVTTKWLVGSAEDVPPTVHEVSSADTTVTETTKSISIVSSALSSLFPPTSEGGVKPEGAVVVVESNSGMPPVHILVHTSDAGECPSGQCVLYASTAVAPSFDILNSAVTSLLCSVGEEPVPQVLWRLQYVQRGPTSSRTLDERPDSNVVLLSPLSTDVVLQDEAMDDVKQAWRKIAGEDDGAFLRFEPREGLAEDEEAICSGSSQFQQETFHALRSEDALLILARGLGLLRLVTNLLHSYDAAGNNLILLVGADDRENNWFGEALAEHAAISGSPKCRGLQLVNTDMMSVGTREKMYAGGGIFSITSRILIVDFLSGLLDPATVTGLVVMHAEALAATSLEAFIVRIYRQKNKTGFLKAFSDQPEPFTRGYQPLSSVMRNLFLRKPILYPRFHVTVAKSLEGKRKAEVIELEVPMTDAMRQIQNAVLECVEVSIQELRKANPGVEVDEWTLDSALHRSFDTIIRRQLDPVWHRTSFRTKQTVRDLSLLRTILHSLLSFDAVSFNKYLDTVLAASSPPPGSTKQSQSQWLFLDAAHTLFDTAKRRVYTGKITEGRAAADGDGLDPVLEELPKWGLLAEILEEIENDMYLNPRPMDESSGSILIMCGDQGTCRQLREFLQTMHVDDGESANGNTEEDGSPHEKKPSANFMMRRKLRSYLQWKRDFARVSSNLFAENEKAINGTASHPSGQANRGRAPPNKRRRVRGGGNVASVQRTASGSVNVAGDRDAHIQALMHELAPNETEEGMKLDVGADPLDDMEDYYELYDMKDLVVVHPYDSDMDDHLLEEIKPRYVVMYEPDAAFIRRIEVYRSSHSRQVRVYFLYYGGSVEEQRYLSAVRREKDAFTKLIRERANMALTFTHDTANLDPQESFLRTFRSSLPSLLHGRNMMVIPCMLTVGDYVLTPQICIERKSIKDLVSSFADGRLYNQAETMLQHYTSPMLLIEFDAQKAFTLEPFADLSSSLGTSSLAGTDLQSKLVLLTLAFPRLRIIWSSSPYQTAEIFDELKKSQPEPDPLRAVQIGLGEGDDPEGRTFNRVPQEMLRAVPGVTPKALQRLVLEYRDVRDVANAGAEELAALIGRESARQIRAFFDRSVWDVGDE
ncbi:DNA repair protein rad16-like [Teratosphaeria destructans]|uniref:DNA repair protein rad16-like n=1 Tax=Teratosphaeria destructans TaxID=418781 RepID=A0A9W7W2R1_9PEZI|nr:DNA repair protein rad16-like [Teratosphaeria destructans]